MFESPTPELPALAPGELAEWLFSRGPEAFLEYATGWATILPAHPHAAVGMQVWGDSRVWLHEIVGIADPVRVWGLQASGQLVEHSYDDDQDRASLSRYRADPVVEYASALMDRDSARHARESRELGGRNATGEAMKRVSEATEPAERHYRDTRARINAALVDVAQRAGEGTRTAVAWEPPRQPITLHR